TAWSARVRWPASRAAENRCHAARTAPAAPFPGWPPACCSCRARLSVQSFGDARARLLGHAPASFATGRYRRQEMHLGIAGRLAQDPHDVRHETLAGAERHVQPALAATAVAQRHRLHGRIGIQRGLEDARMENTQL